MRARRKRSRTDFRIRPRGQAPAATDGRPKASARALAQVIERSYRIQGPAAEAYVSRLRDAHPGASPAEIVAKLEKRYVAIVTASGVAVGAAATIPGIGTLSALSAAAAETVAFLEATAFFVLALAVVHGIPADHRERRRALVLSVLVGDNSKHAVAELIGPGRTNGALDFRRRGRAAAVVDVAVELAVAQVLGQAVHGATQRADVRQDAAGRHRRSSSAPSATTLRARRSSATPAGRSAPRPRAGRAPCTWCRPIHEAG